MIFAPRSTYYTQFQQGYKRKEKDTKKSREKIMQITITIAFGSYLKFRKRLQCLTHCLVVVLLNMHPPHLESLNTLLDYNDTIATTKFAFQFRKRELFASSSFCVAFCTPQFEEFTQQISDNLRDN